MSNACFRLKDEKKFEKRLTKKKFEKENKISQNK
jgi:hypothetical protein